MWLGVDVLVGGMGSNSDGVWDGGEDGEEKVFEGKVHLWICCGLGLNFCSDEDDLILWSSNGG